MIISTLSNKKTKRRQVRNGSTYCHLVNKRNGRDDDDGEDENDIKYIVQDDSNLVRMIRIRSPSFPWCGAVARVRQEGRGQSRTASPPNYRIKKLCATANAHTAPHARNPSGYPDGSFCVLADQSCQHVHAMSTSENKEKENGRLT